MKTKKLNSHSFIILCFGLLILSACRNKTHQSDTLTDYSNQDGKEMNVLYFYPSTIRMVAKILGDEKGQALNEVQRARFLFSLSGDESKIAETFKLFKSGIKSEGFEMLMQMSSSGNKVDIYMLDGDMDDYILFVSGAQGSFVLEILGNLSANAIRDISQLDMTVLTDVFQDEILEMEESTKIDSLQIRNQ